MNRDERLILLLTALLCVSILSVTFVWQAAYSVPLA